MPPKTRAVRRGAADRAGGMAGNAAFPGGVGNGESRHLCRVGFENVECGIRRWRTESPLFGAEHTGFNVNSSLVSIFAFWLSSPVKNEQKDYGINI